MHLLKFSSKICTFLSEAFEWASRLCADATLRQRQQSIKAMLPLRIGVTGSTCGFDPRSTGSYPVSSANFHTSTPGHGGQADSKPAGQRSIRWVCAIVPSSSGQRHSVVSGESAGSNPVGTDL